jgi:peptide/nickel transport system substrate-binding protein
LGIAPVGAHAATEGHAAVANVLIGTPSSVGPWTDSFNPLVPSAQSASGFAGYLIYEPLYQFNYATDKLTPWLATAYKWSGGGKELTLKLRSGVKWSDGKAFTAADVAFTFNLLKRFPALNSNGLPITKAIARGVGTVTIQFAAPAYQTIYSVLATDPVPESIWSKVANPVTYDVTNPVGTGPYVLKNFSTETITLDRNLHYWGAKPRVPVVEYVAETSTTSALTSLESGATEWMNQVVTSPLTSWRDGDPKQRHVVSFPSTAIGIVPNVRDYPLNESAVRQAIFDAISPKAVVKLTQNGIVPPFASPTGLLPAEESSIAPKFAKSTFPASAAKARAVLEAAGYKMGSNGVFTGPHGPVSFNLLVPSPYGSMVATLPVLESELKAAGIQMTPEETSVATWTSDENLGQFQASLAISSNISAVDPYYFFQEYMDYGLSAPVGKTATEDIGRFKNVAATKLLSQLSGLAPGSPSSGRLLSGLESIQLKDMPFIPVDYNPQMGIFTSTNFVGWPSTKNPYATPVMHQPSAEVVLLHLKPRK